MSERASLCECGHPREPNHLTPGAECSQSGAPGGCGCVRFKPKQELFDARDPRWKRCLEGCRPAAKMHRRDCPNVADLLEENLVKAFEGIANHEEKTTEQVVEEFFSGYMEGAVEE